tara:strand:+ start:1030 stop:1197 length:168 start_codon:yes stop_codon:yes gene_type:complete
MVAFQDIKKIARQYRKELIVTVIDGAVCSVLATDIYAPNDYIPDYSQFLILSNGK